MAFTIANCIVTKEFIVVTYTGSPVFAQPLTVAPFSITINANAAPFPTNASHTFVSSIPASIISWPRPKGQNPFLGVGDSFTLQVTDSANTQATFGGFVTQGTPEAIALLAGLIGPPVTGAITDASTAIQEAINAPTFPILTEEIGYPPSPLAKQSGGTGGGGGAALGQVVSQALNGVLGWKLKSDDPKGFLAALNASFTCTEVEGHSICTWQPRSYIVQSDITGGITGAQASIFARAKDALDQSLPLLKGLYPLDPAADLEIAEAIREAVSSQLTQVVNEFGYLGGPRVSRVNTYFSILLGASFTPGVLLTSNSDQIGGSLGDLRDRFKIFTVSGGTRNSFINSVEDEQDTTNFRVLADYVTSLAQSWINNLPFFAGSGGATFFGTQLVQISRQLTVVSEDVDEVRFAMDSVFIGPDERQALEVNFGGTIVMFFEDFAQWVQSFVTTEAQQLIQSGGIYGVRFTVKPIIIQLQGFASGCLDPNPANIGLTPGFHTGRVQQSLRQLADDLGKLQTALTVI